MNNLIDGLLVDVYAYLLPELGHAAASSQFVRAADCAGRMRIAETYAELKGLLGVVGSCCLPMVRVLVLVLVLRLFRFALLREVSGTRGELESGRSVCNLGRSWPANRVKASCCRPRSLAGLQRLPQCPRLDHLAARAQVHQRA